MSWFDNDLVPHIIRPHETIAITYSLTGDMIKIYLLVFQLIGLGKHILILEYQILILAKFITSPKPKKKGLLLNSARTNGPENI